jgi:parallel beta-helix repeat protein
MSFRTTRVTVSKSRKARRASDQPLSMMRRKQIRTGLKATAALGIVVSRGSTVRIAGNTIRSSGQNGVYVEKMSQADVSSNTIEDNAQNGIQAIQNSGVNLGADTGSSSESMPNSTGTPNGQMGIACSLGAYAAGRLGTLMGAKGPKSFSAGANDSLLTLSTEASDALTPSSLTTKPSDNRALRPLASRSPFGCTAQFSSKSAVQKRPVDTAGGSLDDLPILP